MSQHETTAAVLARYPGADRSSLIPILQEVQAAEGFLSRPTMRLVASHLALPVSKVYGVATFYNQFRFEPRGRFHIQVCRGTACHVKGSKRVLEALERHLGVAAGRTTRDGLFSLEVVACIGACGLAPVVAINGEFHGSVSPGDVEGLLARCRARAEEEEVADGEVA